MTDSQANFVWYELMTEDVPAAKKFYGDVVGWHVADVPMPGMTYTMLSMGETQVGGMMTTPQEAVDKGVQPMWIGYIHTPDVDAATGKVPALGGQVRRLPADIPDVGRFSVVVDGQGALFQLFTSHQPGGRVASKAPGNVGWHELHSTDWPKAFEFYSSMFGWEKGSSVDMGPMGTYQLFHINGEELGAMFNSPLAAAHPLWLYYFNVGEIDAAAKRVTDGGGSILMGPQPVPGGQWIVQCKDPQGALFALVGSHA